MHIIMHYALDVITITCVHYLCTSVHTLAVYQFHMLMQLLRSLSRSFSNS